MRPLGVVVDEPSVQIGLQLLQRRVQLLAKDQLEELTLDRAAEALDKAVGLGATHPGASGLDVVQSQVQLEWDRLHLRRRYGRMIFRMYGSMTQGATPVPEPKLSKVQEKGQVTIPAEIRDKLGLKKGDLVAFVETEQGVLISPQEVVAQQALDRIGEILKEKGISLEELMESGREIRGDLVKEQYGIDASE
jgi:antitoxin PrlF